jgi:hypothetical protein
MSDHDLADWTGACRAEGLDPGEVRLVLERYRAYRAYYLDGRRGEPLPVETWFTWYHRETASETGQQAPAPSGCSVDDDARNRGAVRKPQAFLRLLAQLAAIELVA